MCNVTRADISTGFKTDLSLVTIKIALHSNTRGPGVWKLNSSLFREIEYKNQIRQIIEINNWNNWAFYENLYTKAPCDISARDAFLGDPNLVKLDENELNELEQPLSKTECFNVLKHCAKKKYPGSDGLSVEFYLHFWHLLGVEMVQSFNYAHKLGQLNITQRQGI